MFIFASHEPTRRRFCHDLRQHIIASYESAARDAEVCAAMATDLKQKALHLHDSRRPTPTGSEYQETILGFWDYAMRARDAARCASFYHDAYHSVSSVQAWDIDLDHPSLAPLAKLYFPHWKDRWLKAVRATAFALGLNLSFTPLDAVSSPENDEEEAREEDEAEEDEATGEWKERLSNDRAVHFYQADGCVFGGYEDDSATESDGQTSSEYGLWEVYSRYGAQPEVDTERAADEDTSSEAEPAAEPVPLDELLERSPHRAVFAPLASELLQTASLLSEEKLDRTRCVLYDVLSSLHLYKTIDESQLREEIKDRLEDSAADEEPQFPPEFHRRTSGYGQFLRGLMEYEGTAPDNPAWSIIDDL